jgi:hypothetical protein
VWLDVLVQLQAFVRAQGFSDSVPSSVRLSNDNENEVCFLWEALQAETQSQLYAHAIGLMGEERHKNTILQELRSNAEELFVPENALLVERLCVELGYIDEADAGKLYQGSQEVPWDPLELLKGSSSLPDGMTRYEALYVPGSGIDTQLFFSNPLYNANLDNAQPGVGWRRMVDVLANIASTCGDAPNANLLRRLSSVAQKLFTIHTPREYPEHLAKADAWNALRRAWLEPSYYFSIEELQFAMALTGTCVRVYTFEACVPGGVGYFHEMASSCDLLGGIAAGDSLKHVVYDGSSRGHFSRLLSDDEEWVAEDLAEEEEEERARRDAVRREQEEVRRQAAEEAEALRQQKAAEEVRRREVAEAEERRLEDVRRRQEAQAQDGAASKRQRLQERLKELTAEHAKKRQRQLAESRQQQPAKTDVPQEQEEATGKRRRLLERLEELKRLAEESKAEGVPNTDAESGEKATDEGARSEAAALRRRQELQERLDEIKRRREEADVASAEKDGQAEAPAAEEESEEGDQAMAKARRMRREIQFRGLFNVRMVSDRPRCTEPERMHVAARSLADHLRKHVTVPADWANPEKPFLDVAKGNRLPPVSCAFKDCRWHGGNERVTRAMREAAKDDRTGTYEHPWDFQLRAHVLNDHAASLESVLGGLQLPREVAWDVYKEALAVRQRSTEQIAGPSIDRRSLEYTLQLYNDDMVRSLICGVCARIRVDTGHVHSDIGFRSGGWLLTLEDKHPGIIEKVCSQARFDKHYRQPGMPLASTGNTGSHDVQGPDFCDWQLTLHAELFARGQKQRPRLKRLCDALGNVTLLCCPEDHECEATCVDDKTLCAKCRIPICHECQVKIQSNEMPPKALMNENFQGQPFSTCLMSYQNVKARL